MAPKKIPTVADLLRNAAELSAQAADRADAGDVDAALKLEREADALRRRARRRAQRRAPAGEPTTRAQSAREAAVAALNELEVPSSPREISDYSLARFGRALDHKAFASIRRDERRAFDSPRTHRAVYIVPALEGRWLLPARGRFALSEWPVEQRLIGPHSLRVDHLKVTLNMADRFAWLGERDVERAAAMGELLERYARSLVGVSDNGKLDPTRIRAAVESELEILRPDDDAWREQAAVRVGRLSSEQQLWGAEPPRLVEGSR